MKQKKKWVIPLCVIGVILLLCAGGLCYMINHSMSFWSRQDLCAKLFAGSG